MSDPVIVVRPALLTDSDEVMHLAGLMYEAMGVDASGAAWRSAGTDALASRLGHDAAVYVAEHPGAPGRLVACGGGTISVRLPGPHNPHPASGYIQWISTDPEWRSRGLARRIMVALLDWYDRKGVRSVELHATATGEPLYCSLGFVEGPYRALRRRT
ncbi:MAG: GNAT family N-acetyltransferase [Actinomycetota bacterium]|nr:GNAT family N-acetyltransferase [Actinomycetota bacterium]